MWHKLKLIYNLMKGGENMVAIYISLIIQLPDVYKIQNVPSIIRADVQEGLIALGFDDLATIPE